MSFPIPGEEISTLAVRDSSWNIFCICPNLNNYHLLLYCPIFFWLNTFKTQQSRQPSRTHSHSAECSEKWVPLPSSLGRTPIASASDGSERQQPGCAPESAAAAHPDLHPPCAAGARLCWGWAGLVRPVAQEGNGVTWKELNLVLGILVRPVKGCINLYNHSKSHHCVYP